MGGDHGPSVTIPAAISFVKSEPGAALILVGLEDVIRAELKKHHADAHPQLTVVHASEQVTMDDPLEVALRRKKDSSMRVAIEQVKDGKAQACVSAGNTGALMAVSRYVLKTLAGVDRPPSAASCPTRKTAPPICWTWAPTSIASRTTCTSSPSWARCWCRAMEQIARPTIGLLNVGTEDIKGNEVVKATGKLLQIDHERGALNFHGNVEGNDIFKGTTDLVVCDGFVGNVTLKAIEGVARFFGDTVRAEFTRNWLTKLSALIGYGALKSIRKRFQPSRYNGASLLGLRGLVFKSHGGADAYSFEWAIKRAYDAAQNDVLAQISTMIADLMPRGTVTAEVPSSTI